MSIALSAFTKSMKDVESFLDLVKGVQNLASHDVVSLTSTNGSDIIAKNIHTTAISMSFSGVLAYEGAFLYSCAQFEDTIRKLIEGYLIKLQSKKPNYSDLPDVITKRHMKGVALIITKIDKKDQFAHLSADTMVQKLNNCLMTPSNYQLIPEAFTSNENNFRSTVLEEHFQYVGIAKILDLAARKHPLRNYFGFPGVQDIAGRTRSFLNGLMDERNRIMHRNPSFSTPGETRVRECAAFFAVLMDSLERTLIAEIRKVV